MTFPPRRLGRSELLVSAVGMGCNAIGGPMWDRSVRTDQPAGYGQVDDAESIRAIRKAIHLGITLFDTADEYGCGHSETILGKALGQDRNSVIISTKFGFTFSEANREITGKDASPAYIRQACEASLRRLDRDYLDLYLLHIRDLDLNEAVLVRETLEELVTAGKIRWYGWSTDDPERARCFAQGPHCAAIEHRLNLLLDAPEMLTLCEAQDLASINRIPLLMGILSGRYTPNHLPPEDDVRSLFFQRSAFARDVERVSEVKAILTQASRTLSQGALAWILSRSPITIPIPGFRTEQQVKENAGTRMGDPLSPEAMNAIRSMVNQPIIKET
jgi:aryl-alcohol dehydrogenase-like predicted oxidoreductase